MSTPEITVLLTVFNGMPYLPAAVESILSQSRRDFTFLILNNGSKDSSGIYLNSLTDPRLSVTHLPETLPRTAALNKGLDMVETPFTAIIDADDVAAPGRLQRQAAFLEAHPDVALVGCDVRYIDPQGNELGQEHFPAEHEQLVARMPLFNQFAHAGCMFRTEAVIAVGGYPPSHPYAHDLALWLSLFHKGYRAASIPEVLADIRVHPGQQTRSAALAAARAADDAFVSEAMLELPGFPPCSRQAARIRLGMALRRQGHREDALREIWRAVREAPLLLWVNPLLWERLFREMKRLWKRIVS